ncbi:element excision factor XisH family protein [Trichormus sp. NMC-1]|uniref:element excision factor XisH family protein n=1 Tax=Trichormus sp. NMC-1 TaxID=1853259 RepID=UPI0008DC0CE6|nr:element excision factor XisH family protein [Trichormus sp. NMC-1]
MIAALVTIIKLIKEGWIITNDPLHLKWSQKDMYVDLGEKKLLAAGKGTKKIAVEIKSIVLGFHTQNVRQYTGYAVR